MSLTARALVGAALIAGPAIAGVSHLQGSRSPATLGDHFSASPITQAGTIPAGGSKVFYVYTPRPDTVVYISYSQNSRIPGDQTLLPTPQCNTSVLGVQGDWATCTSDSLGRIALTYELPSPLVAQGSVAWVVNSGQGTYTAYTHYVSSTVMRFEQSPLATPGVLTAGQSVTTNLDLDSSLDQGQPGEPAYLSLRSVAGGGSATANGVPLTTTPTEFFANTAGQIPITYTAPATLPASGADEIVAQDLPTSPSEVTTTSYAYAAGTPVISIGDVTIAAAQAKPTVAARFAVQVTPAVPYPVSFTWTDLCGQGDKWCSEDIRVVTTPQTVTIPANHTTAWVNTAVDSYGGKNGGEDYNEGWFVHLNAAGGGAILGRSMGEGTQVETDGAGIALYAGSASIPATTDTAGTTLYFTVTNAQTQNYPITFDYATFDGSAVNGKDYRGLSGTATIPAGSNNVLVPVHIMREVGLAAPISFNLTISNASAGAIALPTGTGTVLPAVS